jgi:hypothetical protein
MCLPGIIAGQLRRVRARAGRYLVVLAVHRSHALSHDSPQSAAAARVRLAGRFFRDHRGHAFSADGNLALLAELHFQPGKPWPVGMALAEL